MKCLLHTFAVAASITFLSCGSSGGKGSTGAAGQAGAAGKNGVDGTNGTNGAVGKDGADGNIRIYGDGSAGALNITAPTDWTSAPPANDNYQFTDCTIAAGAQLQVASGAVVRCSGTFTLAGDIHVFTYAGGGSSAYVTDAGAVAEQQASSGIAADAAGNGQLTANGQRAFGGSWGSSFTAGSAAPILHPGPLGGGGGGAGWYPGGAGGGTLTVLAKAGLTVSGTISANGDIAYGPTYSTTDLAGGGGGGGGGIVILASPASVAVTGSVSAKGGDGAQRGSTTAYGGITFSHGGGGGGGIVHLLAPVISVPSLTNVDVSSGASGSKAATSGSQAHFLGGGGGGGGGGLGQFGGTVNANGTFADGITTSAPPPGLLIQDLVDPTDLF